ncbi:MAG: 4Fe-4S binding protein, partial [Planctomycetota bacterium]|nr:4Fe-4S binding protein [Planctomycetota bacterium]
SRVLRLVPIAAFIWMFLVPLFARISGPRAIAITTEWHTTAFWETFPGPFISVLTLVVAGCYVVYLLGNKAYCNYACPYGAIIGASDSFSVGKIVVDADKCNSCMDCTRACSSDVVVHHEIKEFGAVVDNNCMKTLDCVAACPNQALSFQISKPAVFRAPENPSAPSKSQLGFKQELILAVGFLFGFFATHDLFGAVPFLLALGFGLVSAHGALLLSKNKISFDLNKKNIAWIAACLFFIHAAVVQSQALVRDHWFDKSFDIRMAYLRGDVEVPLTSESLELLQTANKYAQRVSAISYAGHERNDYIDGWAKLFDGDRQGFEQAMHRVLERRPGFGEVLFQLGIHHWVSGSDEQAIATLASIQESDGKYAIAQEYISKITSHQLEHQH